MPTDVRTTIQRTGTGVPQGQVWLTDEEFTELLLLIDDEPVDEELLAGIRKKLALKRRRLRRAVEAQS